MHPTDKAARTAGAVYLLAILSGPFSLLYIPSVFVVSGNAAASADNIRAHELLFRFGIAGDLLNGVLILAVTLALYRLFEAVDRKLAALLVILGGLMVTPIFFLNSLNWIAALSLAHGAPFLDVFEKAQRDALALLFLRLHGQGNTVNELFWGLWLFPFGALVVKSRFLPRFLGYWLLLGGVAYVAISFAGIVAPQFQDALFTYAQPVMFGEIAITLWLLIKGANVTDTLAARS